MAGSDFDDTDVTSPTAYSNRVLLLALIEALEVRGISGLSKDLVTGLSQSIGKEPQARVDAIAELTDELNTISEVARLRKGCFAKRHH